MDPSCVPSTVSRLKTIKRNSKQCCYIHTMEYYVTAESNKLTHEAKQKNFKSMMLSERRQLESCRLYDTIYMIFWKRPKHTNRKQISGHQEVGQSETTAGKCWMIEAFCILTMVRIARSPYTCTPKRLSSTKYKWHFNTPDFKMCQLPPCIQ